MNAYHRLTLGSIVTALVVMLACPPVARGNDDWEDRWEDYEEELEERREEYEERLEDRRDSLEEYWEEQREAQRDFGRRRGHAWYGYYGPYYGGRVVPNDRIYGPRQFFAPGPSPGHYGQAPDLLCPAHGCEAAGAGCRDGLYGGSLSIGPIRVFWE